MSAFRRLSMGEGTCPRCGEDLHVHTQRLVVERPEIRVLGFTLRPLRLAHWQVFCAMCGFDYTVAATRTTGAAE